MQKHILYSLIFATTVSLISCTSSYVVRERPAEVVYVRPAAPSREHIWVSGDWVWAGGRYQWHEGHWERHHQGQTWADGHWKSAKGGWKWVPGHWK